MGSALNISCFPGGSAILPMIVTEGELQVRHIKKISILITTQACYCLTVAIPDV